MSDYSGEIEILVVDNGSAAGLDPDVSGRSRTRLIRQPIGNSYSARNLGIKHARGAIVAFTDADCIPASDWISKAIHHFGNETLAAVAGRIEVFSHCLTRQTLAEIYDSIHAFPQREYVERYGFGVTANLIVTASALEILGGFKTDSQSGGDRILGEDLGRAGMRLVYRDDVVVRHPARASIRELYEKKIRVASAVVEARHRRGERLSMPVAEAGRRLVPPRSVVRRAFTDPRLKSPSTRFRYIAAGIIIRYVDFVAWMVAIRRTSRSQGRGLAES